MLLEKYYLVRISFWTKKNLYGGTKMSVQNNCLNIKKEVFENDNKEEVCFYPITLKINGMKLELQVKTRSKDMFEYFLQQNGIDKGELNYEIIKKN